MNKILALSVLLFYVLNVFSQENSNFRDEIDVIHYEINFNITDFKNKIISGNTLIDIKSQKNNLKKISLELEDLAVDKIFANSIEVKKFDYNKQLITIPLKQKLDSGKLIKVEILYHGKPKKHDRWGGFIFKDSVAFNMGVGMGASPHTYGRAWFPCIDSFTDRATFSYNITTQGDFLAICSGIQKKVKNNKDGTKTFSWVMKKSIPTYLSSVVVGQYKRIRKIYDPENRKIPADIYLRKKQLPKEKGSFENLFNAISTFEKHYGNYRWDRFGYAVVPFNSGAMEHACSIAYPEYAVNGTTENETLMAHELSHSWFGNLVTCETEKDMWLNEGWASYSEALFKESVYGKNEYADYVRMNHEKVLEVTHLYDKGYRAVYGIPHEFTYGSTVYDKGADVVHTLRNYMGDSLFFSSVTAYLQEFAFSSASTNDLRDFLSKKSGIKLNDFFDTWVFKKGFPHFSIDYYYRKIGENYRTTVIVNQKTKERDFIGKNNIVELSFYDKYLNKIVKTVSFSGAEKKMTFYLPVEPAGIFIDLDEKISDATIDNFKIISEAGTYDFPNTGFSAELTEVKDSILLRCTSNYIYAGKKENFILSKKKYWTLESVNYENFVGYGSFYINTVNDGFEKKLEDIVLLFRELNTDKWEKIPFAIQSINKYEGYLLVTGLKPGDYVTAIKTTKDDNKRSPK